MEEIAGDAWVACFVPYLVASSHEVLLCEASGALEGLEGE